MGGRSNLRRLQDWNDRCAEGIRDEFNDPGVPVLSVPYTTTNVVSWHPSFAVDGVCSHTHVELADVNPYYPYAQYMYVEEHTGAIYLTGCGNSCPNGAFTYRLRVLEKESSYSYYTNVFTADQKGCRLSDFTLPALSQTQLNAIVDNPASSLTLPLWQSADSLYDYAYCASSSLSLTVTDSNS